MSYINLIKDTEVDLGNIRGGYVDGEFKLVAFKGFEFPKGSGKVWKYPGTSRLLQDWTSNLITNNGLDHYGAVNNAMSYYFHVGTGNTTPQNTDTSLQTHVATVVRNDSTAWAQGTPPYYGTMEVKGLFSPNFAGGNVNLNEIGMSPDNDPNNLGCRALTVDGAGTPTTITVLSDEYLECYYRRRQYPAHIVEATGVPTDDNYPVTIEGVGYTYTIRPAAVTVGGNFSSGTTRGWGSGADYYTLPCVGYGINDVFYSGVAFKTGVTLGAVTSTLVGTTTTSPSASSSGVGTYLGGTYSRECWWQWSIDRANDAGGIGGLVLKNNRGAYQMVFNTGIPKVYGQVFTFYHNFSWARKNPPWL